MLDTKDTSLMIKGLEFIEQAYKSAFVLNSKRPNIEAPMIDPKFNRVVEYNYYLRPELESLLYKYEIEAAVLKNEKTGNILVCYFDEQKDKMQELNKVLYESCKNYPTSDAILRNINDSIDNSTICHLNGLSDFQLHTLAQTLPFYHVQFSEHIVTDGQHEISFLSGDLKSVNKCLAETADYLISPRGIQDMRDFKIKQTAFHEIEKRTKNKEKSYVLSNEDNKYIELSADTYKLKVEKNNVQKSFETKNSFLEGNIFKNSIWNEIAIQVDTFKNPVVLSQDEFELPKDERENLITEKLQEIKGSVDVEESVTPEELLHTIKRGLDVPDNSLERSSLEELE